jgi:hypothetical protein
MNINPNREVLFPPPNAVISISRPIALVVLPTKLMQLTINHPRQSMLVNSYAMTSCITNPKDSIAGTINS